MKILIALFLVGSFISCSRKPYVEHKIELEKKGENCNNVSFDFKMDSNFGGERFEFEKCIPVNYSKDKIVSERKGDTVVVRFTNVEDQPRATFKCTLDIDSYPAYHYITIDQDTYVIAATSK